ncbi:hypothetical protein YPPY14_3298, partial [Yersinia pestis PY-14]
MMMLTVWDQQPLKKALCSQQVLFLCPENPQLGWGFSKAFSFGSVI